MTGSAGRNTTDERAAVPVWDRPVRAVHWLLVLLIPFAWWTAEEELMDWHSRAGLAVLGLLVFRLVWGLIGSSTARFSSFVRGPRAIADYLRGRPGFVLGHNPVGALSVLALLGLAGLETVLGLFASDEDGYLTGPFVSLVSEDMAETLTELHEDAFDWLLVLIVLHVAAILFYLLVKRENLVVPMLSGRKAAPAGADGMIAAPASRFFLAAGIAAGTVYFVA